jgi:cellulose synthase operon protein C
MATDKTTKTQRAQRRIKNLCVFVSLWLSLYLGLIIFSPVHLSADPGKDERATLIETALFTRSDFFGARALVPYPTAEARNRLADLQKRYPDDSGIYLKLSQLDEKLGNIDRAEKELQKYVELEKNSSKSLETLADFFQRRAEFSREAETLDRMVSVAEPEERIGILNRLIGLARTHGLKKYFNAEFYKRVVVRDPTVFELFDQYVKQLVEEENYREALEFLRQNRDNFPEQKNYFIKEEVSILGSAGRLDEAEKVYVKAFNPFWPQEMLDEFYGFLEENNRLKAYGRDLREAFKRNPTDYDLAVRLIHFRKRSYEPSADVIEKLEAARAARGIAWKPDELASISEVLLAIGNYDDATRFLYTLYTQGKLKQGSPVRARVLYQLFKILSNETTQRFPLTRGDLSFYQNIATSDPHPGIVGGLLSLIFSDSNPGSEYRQEEGEALKHFNRAAAYRIFTAYKEENPTSPELAQMYLDIVRLYSAAGEPKVAADALAEFQRRYKNTQQFPEVALKLADCYITNGKYDEERSIYLQIMDYLGKNRKLGQSLLTHASHAESRKEALNVYSEPTEIKPAVAAYPPNSNIGIEVRGDDSDNSSDESYSSYSSGKDLEVKRDLWQSVDYSTVMERYVASLSREGRTKDILALYSQEIKKYPDEEGLYEQLLQWLGQTNFVEEQLKVYNEAIKQFPDVVWYDRMARWFLRRDKKTEFEKFSRELLGKFNDREIEIYLSKFVGSGATANASTFDAKLYLGLYSLARERFPHNLNFVNGILKYYSSHNQWQPWRTLMAEYYFESPEIRGQFLSFLAGRNELRGHLEKARSICAASSKTDPTAVSTLPYKLFRSDAAVWLANYEEAIDAYRELNRLYPNTPEFSDRLVAFSRSFGQQNRKFLEEAAAVQQSLADAFPASADYRTRAGEIFAELADYKRAGKEWEQLLSLGVREKQVYLDTATVYWDYFQYDDAMRTINRLRDNFQDKDLYAFQMGAILEAKHRTHEAIAEYVKALDENEEDYRGARRRLLTLYKRPGIPEELARAFNRELSSRRKRSPLVLGYVDLLRRSKRWDIASAILKKEVNLSSSQDFLDRARDIFAEEDDTKGEFLTLNRLISAAKTTRFNISYYLQLAEAYKSRGDRNGSATTLNALLRKYPTNYGVLNESANFYWRIGLRESSIRVLEEGMKLGKGRYHYNFARKLASRHVGMNNMVAAERVLHRLHDENKLNSEVFDELAQIYVRTSNREALRKLFGETLESIKKQDIDIKEMRSQIAELRKQMITAFTQLKDYNAAVEQHIEIINREPEDEERLNAALEYTKRYGGADRLLAYYQKTSEQAYKNYRWNVVLARIYETKGDLSAAARNYRMAIGNQPEMLELYEALAAVCSRMKDYNAAYDSLKHATDLSNGDPRYIKQIVEVLEKAGRTREAIAYRKQLPQQEEPKKQTVGDKFAEAQRLQNTEQARAIETYRNAFNEFLSNPYKHDLRGDEITGYARALRHEESLDRIFNRLWDAREKMIREADSEKNDKAAKARSLIQVIDGALPEAIGGLASERATGDELAALHRELQSRIDNAIEKGYKYDSLSLLQNLSNRSGFDSLVEKILIVQKDASAKLNDKSIFDSRLKALLNFYSGRGDYRRVLELVEAESKSNSARNGYEYLRLTAENSRLLGYKEKELEALRSYYRQQCGNILNNSDQMVERYFEILYENGEQGKKELLENVSGSGPCQIRLINFLLARGEKELVHQAINNATMPAVWKLSRNSEVSLAMRDFNPQVETYFLDALQYRNIGELIDRKKDKTDQLSGDDWFKLADSYGQWLFLSERVERRSSGNSTHYKSSALLPAMLENRPADPHAQSGLGRWYLEQKAPQQAVEHLLLALDGKPDDKNIIADLGSAYYLLGDRRKAQEQWSELISDDLPAIEDCELYLNTLVKHGLAAEARERLFPTTIKHLKQANNNGNYYDNEGEDQEPVLSLVYALAGSFGNGRNESEGSEALPPRVEAEKAAYLKKLCAAVPKYRSLPEEIIKESLVAKGLAGQFYEMLIQRSDGIRSYDYDYEYTTQLNSLWSTTEAEEALEHKNSFKVDEPESDRLKWQKEYIDYLIGRRRRADAIKIISSIESDLNRRYARPEWLRLARNRLDIEAGHADKVLDELKHFAGIETGPNLTKIEPPNIERLNRAVSLLRETGRGADAEKLSRAAYERYLALEQYNPSYFVELSRIAFKNGETSLGLKILQLMLDLTETEKSKETEAEIASLQWVKARAVEDPRIEKPEPSNSINKNLALKFASEIAAQYQQLDAAIDYRRKLQSLNTSDAENRIELVRLLAEKRKYDDAITGLASIISDREATRTSRWRAVWLAPEIIGERKQLWTTLQQSVQAGCPKDIEMITALKALYYSSTGQPAEALRLINTIASDNPNYYLRNFSGLLKNKNRQYSEALSDFSASLTESQASRDQTAFNYAEDDPLRQMIRVYILIDSPRAALKLSETDPDLKIVIVDGSNVAEPEIREEENSPGPATLVKRSLELRDGSRIELLGLLSEASERTGDLNRAVDFEKTRLSLLTRDVERKRSDLRIKRLIVQQKERLNNRAIPYSVDQRLVAQR